MNPEIITRLEKTFPETRYNRAAFEERVEALRTMFPESCAELNDVKRWIATQFL